ncbi:hypothetical protein [Streptomyces sp. NRRL F-2580]|uniref:hypothetical protein n=1 Tax=Streptomyces sp. NRRL F-2580 TaxID=1463841 RepID=UPI0006912B02|nr:hypothetical protein [Streptomyces sp. NRRL F-2580]
MPGSPSGGRLRQLRRPGAPELFTTLGALSVALEYFYERAGVLPLRRLQKQMGAAHLLPVSEAARIVTREALPASRQQCVAFLTACGLTDRLAGYGLRNTNLSGAPAAKIEFSVDERCLKEGFCAPDKFESKNYGEKQYWWDTPSTLHCKAGSDCYVSSPTFWTRKRLTAVTTKAQRTEGSTDLSFVDRWSLSHYFPEQRTDTSPPLWLESILRTGYSTQKDSADAQLSESLPLVTFRPNGKDMPNRVKDGERPQARLRPPADREHRHRNRRRHPRHLLRTLRGRCTTPAA